MPCVVGSDNSTLLDFLFFDLDRIRFGEIDTGRRFGLFGFILPKQREYIPFALEG
jgi:hypothetical protein